MEPRTNVLAALRALHDVSKNPDDLPKVFTVIENLPGNSPRQMLARMKKEGKKLLEERPNLALRLSDRAALRALPAGTLGRAYADFADAAGITPEGIVQAAEEGGRGESLSEEHRYIADRMRDTHDLWHVVTGYGVDLVGEVSVLSFSYAQTRHPGILLICFLSLVRRLPGALSSMIKAYRRGARAAWLPAVAWEELLDQPLEEVRVKLGIDTLPSYTPVTTTELREGGFLPA